MGLGHRVVPRAFELTSATGGESRHGEEESYHALTPPSLFCCSAGLRGLYSADMFIMMVMRLSQRWLEDGWKMFFEPSSAVTCATEANRCSGRGARFPLADAIQVAQARPPPSVPRPPSPRPSALSRPQP